MQQSVRRSFLLVGTVAVGLFLVFFDAPLFLVMIGTGSMGAMLLVLLGSKTKTNKDISPVPEKVDPSVREEKRRFSLFRKKGQSTDKKTLRVRISGFFGSLGSVFSAMTGALHHRSDPEKLKEIDLQLERTITEPISRAVDDIVPENVKDIRGVLEDIEEIGALEFDEDMDLSINPDEQDSGEDTEFKLPEVIPSLKTPENLNEPLDFELTEEFPTREEQDDATQFDLPDSGEGLDELSGLHDIDIEEDLSLESLELEGTADVEKIIPPVDHEPPAVKEAQDEKGAGFQPPAASGKEEMISFDIDDSDSEIMDLLRSESKQKVSIQDLSLVRDLKDTVVDTRELEKELVEVIEVLGGKGGVKGKRD